MLVIYYALWPQNTFSMLNVFKTGNGKYSFNPFFWISGEDYSINVLIWEPVFF